MAPRSPARVIMTSDQAPGLEFAFQALVSVSPAIDAGLIDGGRRRIIPITGGTVEAPAGPHHWLSRSIFVATARREPAGVLLRFFAVL